MFELQRGHIIWITLAVHSKMLPSLGCCRALIDVFFSFPGGGGGGNCVFFSMERRWIPDSNSVLRRNRFLIHCSAQRAMLHIQRAVPGKGLGCHLPGWPGRASDGSRQHSWSSWKRLSCWCRKQGWGGVHVFSGKQSQKKTMASNQQHLNFHHSLFQSS